jgi:hypothetical protein
MLTAGGVGRGGIEYEETMLSTTFSVEIGREKKGRKW